MWWEKTIEYMFVVTYLNREILMAPLDGDYEAAGDLIAKHGNMWLLIEFKRNIRDVKSEIKKFAEPSLESFDNAKAALSDNDGHHFLIFGEPGCTTPIELKALTYFRHKSVDPNEVLGCGVTQAEFNSYLNDFLYFKFGETEEGSGGRSLDYSTVLALGSNGKVTHCEGLASYCDRMSIGPDLTPEPTPTQRSSYSRGGPS